MLELIDIKKKDMAVKKYCMESASNLKMVFMD